MHLLHSFSGMIDVQDVIPFNGPDWMRLFPEQVNNKC